MITIARCQNTSVAAAKFITLEGVDGAGKSTHLPFVADYLAAQAPHVIVTREPGGTDLAEQLREAVLAEPMAPLVETLLVFAARADHVERVIRPALEAGPWVICDRFTDATYAYQGGGKKVSFELIGQLGEAAHAGLRPDRTLLFDCSYEVAQQRLSGKSLDRFEREDRGFFERVRDTYMARAKAAPGRIRVIDAAGDMAAIRKSIEGHLKF
jgi:dTMP kinase